MKASPGAIYPHISRDTINAESATHISPQPIKPSGRKGRGIFEDIVTAVCRININAVGRKSIDRGAEAATTYADPLSVFLAD